MTDCLENDVGYIVLCTRQWQDYVVLLSFISNRSHVTSYYDCLENESGYIVYSHDWQDYIYCRSLSIYEVAIAD